MARRKKKRDEGPSGPPGAPEWVVTFTDMISLLVTFFVLLMTFSSLEAFDALKIESFLDATDGVNETSATSITKPSEADQVTASSILRGALTPHSRPPEELPESIEEMGQKMTEGHKALDLSDLTDGLVIEFEGEEGFAPGSAEVSPALAESLGELGRVLEHYPYLVVVEGFTDDAFLPTREYESAEALSLARAESAVRTMLAQSELRPELVQLTGLGAKWPRADNVSPGGRQLNRRVRVRVLSLSRTRASYYEAKRAEEQRG